MATRTLGLAAILLPRTPRARWLTEWAGELAILPTRNARARFVIHLILGMPRLAQTLRHPNTADTDETRSTPKRTAGPAVAGGLCIALTLNTSMTWAAAVVTLGALALATALLFIPTDEPTRRLQKIIEIWRRQGPR